MKPHICPNPKCRKPAYLDQHFVEHCRYVFRIRCSNHHCDYKGPSVEVRESSEDRCRARFPKAQQQAYHAWNQLKDLSPGQVAEIEENDALRRRGRELAKIHGGVRNRKLET